jgi:RNA polymerase sigma-70 factor (ECF subfamily)
MTGSFHDAEDVVQETYLKALRGLRTFEGRSSLTTWLYRIATNTCLTSLRHRSRRVLPSGLGAPADDADVSIRDDHTVSWLEPLPQAAAGSTATDPGELAVLRDSVRLALIAALQHLPPRQRAALLLREVLSWSAADIAETLDVSVPATKSLLQRARARLSEVDEEDADPRPLADEVEEALLRRYITAFEAGDADAIRTVIHDDFALEAVPHPVWFQGVRTCLAYWRRRGFGAPGTVRLLPARANGQPALGIYRADDEGVLRATSLVVLTRAGTRFTRATAFIDPTLVTACGLPASLPS